MEKTENKKNLPKKQFNIQRIVWIASIIFICLTIGFGAFIYYTTEKEMANQFNGQQLILAQEAATGIEEYLASLKRNLRQLAAIDDLLWKQDFKTKLYSSIQGTAVIDVWRITKNGVEDRTLSKLADAYSKNLEKQFWGKISGIKPGEIKISAIFQFEQFNISRNKAYNTKAFLIATKLPAAISAGTDEPQVLAFAISLNRIIAKFISHIKSGKSGYAFLLDGNGALLHHPEHPEMINRSIVKVKDKCFGCHISFDMERKITKEKIAGNGRYLAAGKKDKLVAYSPIKIGPHTWMIVISAPFSEVTQLVRKSFYQILFFSLAVISGLLITNFFIFRINKERMQAENRALYADKLEKEVDAQTLEIKQEKQKLDNIISAIGAELSVIDKNFKLLWANKNVTQRVGSLKSITDTHCYETCYRLQRICDNCPAVKTFEHNRVEQHELRLDKNGQVHYYQITTTPICDHTGEVIQVLELTQNITTQKKQEQILVDSEKMSAVGQIAVGLAHDLGNPLAIIAGSAQFCLQNLNPPANITEHLLVINRNASAASKVINALLNFARPSSSNTKFVPINMGDLVQKMLLLLKSELNKKGIKVKREYPPDMPIIMGDRNQLEQVLMNITLNSIEGLTQAGEIRITAESDQTNQLLNLYIIDNGPGIPEEYLASIFDPFFTTRVRGVGLGLSISKRILEQHQGKISAFNLAQGGLKVKISLPIFQEKA